MNRDLEYFLGASEREIREEYIRIFNDTKDDPGTAGDEGEENWAQILKDWLPSNFHVRTKGRIMGYDGKKSPQVDIVVLKPDYPNKLLNKKIYLEAGVLAAFECKNTLKSSHIKKLFENSKVIKGLSVRREGSPYRELHSPIVYGLLAHSHSYKNLNSNPEKNIESSIWTNDSNQISHPIEVPDLVCVSDLGIWSTMKSIVKNKISVYYMKRDIATKSEVPSYFPIGALISALYRKISWEYRNMIPMAQYLSNSAIGGHGTGRQRDYPLTLFSQTVQDNYKKIPFKIHKWDEYTLFFE